MTNLCIDTFRKSGDPRSLARKPKTKAEALGQVFTSSELSKQMVRGLGLTANVKDSRLLDPCVGPATFLKAIAEVNMIKSAKIDAFDLDPDMVNATCTWANQHGHEISVSKLDYLSAPLDTKYDYAILNPPYVRQEWIEKKTYYRDLFKQRYRVDIPSTSNLYVYFIVKVLEDLKVDGQFACIVYDSWQSTRFGQWLYKHLLSVSKDLRIEPVHGLPFQGHMIDATIIYAKKREMAQEPSSLIVATEKASFASSIPGMDQITSLFATKRGLRLKQADFFMTHVDKEESQGAKPFIKKIQLVSGYSVPENHPEAVLLFTSSDSDKRTICELERRLELAKMDPESNLPILTWHRERPDEWMLHNSAPWAPILFNYYIRRRPKHIYNQKRIYSDNFYGLTPLKSGPILAWVAALNSTASTIGFLEQARNQGAGLAKLQLFEYRQAWVLDISQWSKADVSKLASLGESLVANVEPPERIIATIDEVVAQTIRDPRLNPNELQRVFRVVDQHARRPK